MRPALKSVWRFVLYCGDCIVLLACWILWIALGGLLAAQLGIAFSRQFAVPDFVLRSIEARFTASNVNARFGRATFDPTGGILLENLSLSLPQFKEPIASARALFVELDPWVLLTGKIEVRRVQASDITLSIPAMLTSSGRSEALLSQLDFSITPVSNLLQVEHLTGRIAGIALVLEGGFQPQKTLTTDSAAPLPLITTLAQNYGYFCRQLIRAAEELAVFDQPQLHTRLTPSPSYGAIADVRITARTLRLPKFQSLEARELSATIQVPLLGDTPAFSDVKFAADEVRTGGGVIVRSLQASVRGLLNPAHFSYIPQELQFTATDIRAGGFLLGAISSQSKFAAPSSWIGELVSSAEGSPLGAKGEVDLTEKTAMFQLHGEFAPALLDPMSNRLGTDVRRFVDFGEPVKLDLGVSFGPDWKFHHLEGHVDARAIDAYDIPLDSASGTIYFNGRHFIARDAVATLKENVARGSFEQDLLTRDFRFLLEGQLRPLDISGWFGPWWARFFQHFEFPDAPPPANVDVTGRWFTGDKTRVFVFAESKASRIRGTALDYGRTLMFIRPDFFDGLELFGTRGEGRIQGTFSRRIDLERGDWSEMTFALTSTLDLVTAEGLLGPQAPRRMSSFKFSTAPQVTAKGRVDGPASSRGEHLSMVITGQASGPFSIFDFPAQDLSFQATLEDDELTLDQVEARVARGVLTGRAQLSGPDEKRRINFDAALREALLGETITLVSDYSAQRRGLPKGAEEHSGSGKSQVKLDLMLAAEGDLQDLFSFHGTGKAQLTGPELGEVRLLGLLSELLEFTALRFTNAQLDFQLDGRDVVFPSLNVTGQNSAIEGHGDYSLERGEMDFYARVYPFQESKSILQNVVGVMLVPISTMLEVKLTGPLKQPKWAFVRGPTNFFRSLTAPVKPPESPVGASPAAASLPR